MHSRDGSDARMCNFLPAGCPEDHDSLALGTVQVSWVHSTSCTRVNGSLNSPEVLNSMRVVTRFYNVVDALQTMFTIFGQSVKTLELRNFLTFSQLFTTLSNVQMFTPIRYDSNVSNFYPALSRCG